MRAAAGFRPATTMHLMRVLVVEDEPKLAGLLARGLGEEGHPLSEGTFWLRREDTGVGHRIEVGPDGMDLVTMGDLIPGDVVVYPEKRTFKPAHGVELPY